LENAIYQDIHTDKDGNPKKPRCALTEEERTARRKTREARKQAAEAEMEYPTDDDDDDDYGGGGETGSGSEHSSDSEADAVMDNEEVCVLSCFFI
jgi:hypothetical protein